MARNFPTTEQGFRHQEEQIRAVTPSIPQHYLSPPKQRTPPHPKEPFTQQHCSPSNPDENGHSQSPHERDDPANAQTFYSQVPNPQAPSLSQATNIFHPNTSPPQMNANPNGNPHASVMPLKRVPPPEFPPEQVYCLQKRKFSIGEICTPTYRKAK